MRILSKAVTLCLLTASLSACAGIIKELGKDPAIIGITGTWLSIGLEPVPGLPFPLPQIRLGRGTIWRIGGVRNVEIITGERTEIGNQGDNPSLPLPLLLTKGETERGSPLGNGEKERRSAAQRLGGETSLRIKVGDIQEDKSKQEMKTK